MSVFVTYLSGIMTVFVGVWLNSHFTRRRDDRIAKQERCSVAAAIYSEILCLRKELAIVGREVAVRHPALRRSEHSVYDKYFVENNKLSEPLLYKALASKIGALDSELVVPIVTFYANLEEVRKWLPQLIERSDRDYDYDLRYVLLPLCEAIQGVVPTILKIQRAIGIETSGETLKLDLDKVEGAIEHEDAQSEAAAQTA